MLDASPAPASIRTGTFQRRSSRTPSGVRATRCSSLLRSRGTPTVMIMGLSLPRQVPGGTGQDGVMSEQPSSPPRLPLRIGDRRVDHGDDASITVRSPFDGHVVGTVAAGTEADLDDAVATALARHRAGALEAHERAAVLDRAAERLSDPEVQESFARSIADEAAKPIRTARVEATRSVDTFRFAAAAARTLAGELVP